MFENIKEVIRSREYDIQFNGKKKGNKESNGLQNNSQKTQNVLATLQTGR